jgi:hypothetical protein
VTRARTSAGALFSALALCVPANAAPGDAAGAPASPPSDAAGATTSSESSDGPIQKRVAGFATVALGMPSLAFVNELVGARFELGYTPRFSLGMSLAYANLKGKDGRASNVLPEASVAYRIPFGDGAFGIPIRFAGGYLPNNGPTLRLSSGVDFTLGESVACELALLEPMVWVTRDRPELSLNLGAAVRAAF